MAGSKPIPEPIAVVGSSCRLPGGSSSPSKLWSLLKEPRDLLREVPHSRFNVQGFYHEDGEHHGATNATHSYFLDEDEDIRVFDYNFFNINPREAEAMDPQQRILLETVYEGMESSGYSIQTLKGSDTCVFVGQSSDDYTNLLNRDVDTIPNYFATGAARSIMSNRVSYFFDWKGTSVCLDTACSSSLVAVHLGIQELRNGTSKMAVAAGVNLILGPEVYIFESKLHMLSPTGRSRMWDAGADGYARGEGCVAVFLKTLSQAIADGDHIECIIRETGINQDGHTPGITMPSPDAQAALIRATYARAGLDLARKEDRCQYFEAHGTGTPAGDPVEAEALYRAFFSTAEPQADADEPLYVGSIKTVLGHLESGAGLAGFLKASLAVQHGIIPPNMHFNSLNAKITPFYHRLNVPTKALPWPQLPEGTPRRASLNNFGFGGTNAHAIIEHWEPATTGTAETFANGVPHGPFILSANSKSALVASAAAFSDYLSHLDKEAHLSLSDLAWTLQQRTPFSYRAYVSGTTRTEIIDSLAAGLKIAARPEEAGPNTFVTDAMLVTNALPPRILGVFTGQGAQWPGMGSALYEHSALFRSSLQSLEASLAELPEADRPAWSLTEELIKPAATSRIKEAALSQPLCTALQIALVDLLKAAGIEFSGVVGHSSGEIAAAYAAGYLSATDSIRVAYLRGVHAEKAKTGPHPGKMMAVGMSYDEAVSFSSQTKYTGRIVAAASNSRSSTTLSGDADAIAEAEAQLKADGVFARVLLVDTAYHSHHMKLCSDSYLESLKQCNITVLAPDVAPDAGFTWFSSVHGTDGRSIYEPATFKDTYWVDNMAKPVLFSQALDRAVTESHCFDMVLEVGPHPALKGPTSEVLRTITGVDIPYTGVLSRGANDLAAFSSALGFVWSHFQSSEKTVVDFEGFRKACVGSSAALQTPKPRLVKDLPAYAWDHDVPLWKESIVSKKFRLREDRPHELLGTVTPIGNNQEMRWRNVMKINELEWLRGHMFQNQILFPAAGYVSMAVEASIHLAKKNSTAMSGEVADTAQIVELQDLQIHAAITIDADAAGTEVLFVIRVVDRDDSLHQIVAEFNCYSGSVDGTTNDAEKVNFSGRAVITLDSVSDASVLPPRVAPTLPMANVDVTRFYRELEKIGLRYSGDFVVESAQRRLGSSTAVINRPATNGQLIVHPATLDAAFQGVMAAFCFPGDGRMWTSYLPTGIRTVRVNVAAAKLRMQETGENVSQAVADCFLRDASSKVISGDLDLFNANDSSLCEVQITGLTCSSFTKPGPKNDRKTFSKMVWLPEVASGISPEDQPIVKDEMFEEINTLDRISVYFLRRLLEEVSEEEFAAAEWQFRSVMGWAKDYLLPKVDSGQHRRLKPSCINDTAEMVQGWVEKYGHNVDMELAWAVGNNLPAMVRGQVPTLQVLMENNRLNRLYKDGVGIDLVYAQFNALVKQMNHQRPGLRVLEIGAGTGGASVGAIKALSPHFASYTYTDISPAFFEKSKLQFSQEELAKMEFRVLDIERDPVEQGFDEEGYDLILASNVLHATEFLSRTLANCRRITKPGGRMIIIELTGDAIYTSFIMSGLPGWWLGRNDGRRYGPLASEARWDMLMQEAGFSGVDVSCSDLDDFYGLVMSTQAVDNRISLLRDPLSVGTWGSAGSVVAASPITNFVLVGGKTIAVNRTAQTVRRLLRPLGVDVLLVPGVEDLASQKIPAGAAVLCLSDLDEPMFKDLTEPKFKGMQSMILESSALLWVTKNRRTAEPYSNMAIGMARVIAFESPHLVMQFLDVDEFQGGLGNKATAEATLFAETLLRLVYLNSPDFGDVFWVREHELCIEDGRVYVPRIVEDDELNDRLNADRRPITKKLLLGGPEQPGTGNVEVVQESGSIHVLESEPIHLSTSVRTAEDEEASHQIKIQASSLYPVRTRDGKTFYVGVGEDLGDDSKSVLVLSADNGSVVQVAPGNIVQIDLAASNASKPELLQDLLRDLVAESLTSDTEGTLWIHGGDSDLIDRLVTKTSAKSIKLVSTAASGITSEARHRAQASIHRYDTERRILSLLPKGHLTYANLNVAPESEALSRIVRNTSSLSTDTTVDVRPLFKTVQNCQSVSLSLSLLELTAALRRGLESTKTTKGASARLADGIVSIENVPNLPAGSLPPTQVISWATAAPVAAEVFPTSSLSLFKADKTYFLVGLTAELGLSICGWMADHGARHIAIASRNPKVDEAVLEDLKRRGATDMRVFALDISDKQNLLDVHATIKAEMPPIAGVANAAMVLRDKPFDNCSVDDFTYVFGPKVDGSRYMDELFSTPGELDFFIFFSSLACVIGNKGQSNYGAANMYMHTLATQRRQRGLPASIIDIAMLLGVGYVDRALEQLESRLVGVYGYVGLYEPEMHNIFASAILAGHPDSSIGNHAPQIMTGIPVNAGRRFPTKPLFSQVLQEEEQVSSAAGSKAELSTRVLSQLAEAADKGDATLSILEAAFSRKVELILQLPADKIETKVPLIKLGIDSLVAVELRSWFLKELNIDMAVLKFLGGSSILDICRDAIGQLSLSSAPKEVKEVKEVKKAAELIAEAPAPAPVATPKAVTEPATESSPEVAAAATPEPSSDATTESVTGPATESSSELAEPVIEDTPEVVSEPTAETTEAAVESTLEAALEPVVEADPGSAVAISAEAIPEPKVEPTSESTVESVAETAVEPVEATPGPANDTAIETTIEPTTHTTEASVEVATETITEPAVASDIDTPPELDVEPAVETTPEATTEPATPATEALAEPVGEVTNEVAADVAANPTDELTAAATTEASTEPTTETAVEAATAVLEPTAESVSEPTPTLVEEPGTETITPEHEVAAEPETTKLIIEPEAATEFTAEPSTGTSVAASEDTPSSPTTAPTESSSDDGRPRTPVNGHNESFSSPSVAWTPSTPSSTPSSTPMSTPGSINTEKSP
ncbi:lovastatin nonaketide synthase [Ophiostoma piceae UAMH 11346]|uniref:Lovastatin nonaketide synthase n=1 Tax=Ophiostoma piceae (strain UAMH 11346) TaxID=1262450 RepID=S3C2L2_OPHP1|nr:lovastatin nonaketide synthase [Ophiostoma piceae UAMH 11346]